MWELLNEIKTAIDAIPEIDTVKIGAEKGISAKDTPAVRIISEYSELDKRSRYHDQGALQIVLLIDAKNDLESVYQTSITLELKIRDALKDIAMFNRIDYDQDSVTVFKASILRYTFSGIRNTLKECNL